MICNMKNGYCIKSYDKYFFFVSFIFWLMPFLLRMFLIEFPTLPKTSESQTGIIVSQITEALDKEEYFKAVNNINENIINEMSMSGFTVAPESVDRVKTNMKKRNNPIEFK